MKPWTNEHKREALRCILRTVEGFVPGLDLDKALLAGARFTITAKDVIVRDPFANPKIIYEGADRPTKAMLLGPTHVVHVTRIRRAR